MTHDTEAPRGAAPPASTVPATLTPAPPPDGDCPGARQRQRQRQPALDPRLDQSRLTGKYAMFRSIATRLLIMNLVCSHGEGVRVTPVRGHDALARDCKKPRRGGHRVRGGVARAATGARHGTMMSEAAGAAAGRGASCRVRAALKVTLAVAGVVADPPWRPGLPRRPCHSCCPHTHTHINLHRCNTILPSILTAVNEIMTTAQNYPTIHTAAHDRN